MADEKPHSRISHRLFATSRSETGIFMDLKDISRQLIYNENNAAPPCLFEKFGIVRPEYSKHEVEIKEYPMPDSENIFALLWNMTGENRLSATIVPSDAPFTYSCAFKPGTRTQMHSHEYMELFYIVDGEYRQKILGSEFTFHKGELCLIDKNCQHQEILDGSGATVLFLGITDFMFDYIVKHPVTTERISSFLSTALLEQKTLQQYLHFKPHAGADGVMEQTLSSLVEELSRHDEATPFICQGLLIRIFHLLSSQYDFSLSKQLRKQMNVILFEEITDYINRHLNNISIARLSEEFHFQEDYFNRLLKAQTGLTYTEYLQSLRLKRAENLLLNTGLTIDMIAREVGYQNKGYFYKIFTERYRLTPAQLRKKGNLPPGSIGGR